MTGTIKLAAAFMTATIGIIGFKLYSEDRHISDQIRQSYRFTIGEEKPAAVVFAGHINRLCYGLGLLQRNEISRLHISGEIYATTPEKLAVACHRDITSDQKLLISYDNAKTTYENGVLTAAWLRANHIKTAYLITENYHMHRSFLELQRAAPQSQIIAKPILSRIGQSELFAEQSKYLWRLAGLPGFTKQIHSI